MAVTLTKFPTRGILKVETEVTRRREAKRLTMMLINEPADTGPEPTGREITGARGERGPTRGTKPHHRREPDGARVGAGPRSERTLTLATAAREYIWLYDLRHGIGIKEIAAREKLSVGRIRFGLARARGMDKRANQEALLTTSRWGSDVIPVPRLIPLFPIGSYTPQSECPHRGPIEEGSALCCMVCHRSGMDSHPGLRRDPQTDPAPELKAGPAPDLGPQPKDGKRLETRKQRRRRRFAQDAAGEKGRSEESRAEEVRPS